MKFPKIVRDKKGAALFTALILIAVAATLSTALFAYSSGSILDASYKEDAKQVEFLARSGIESAVKVWDEKNNMEKLVSFPVYLSSDGTYRGSDTDAVVYAENETGYYIVTIDPDPDDAPAGAPSDLVKFTSEAHMKNGQKSTKKAYLTESMSGVVDASDWYTDQGILIPGKLNDTDLRYSVANVSSLFKTNKFGDQTLLWGSCGDQGEVPCTLDHILFFEAPSSKALNIGADQKCMFLGRTIYFNMGINFTLSDKQDVGTVVFSGADIIITGDISLIINETGDGCINTVILKTHPEIEEYLYQVDGNPMGRIFFMGNVYLSQFKHKTEEPRITVIPSGSSYYFDGITNGGFDFTKYVIDCYIDNGKGNSVSAGIRSFYNTNVGNIYGDDPESYLKKITSENDSVPPIINTNRMIIWQN